MEEEVINIMSEGKNLKAGGRDGEKWSVLLR